eukprot:1477345-Prymnesium_polylepis.1
MAPESVLYFVIPRHLVVSFTPSSAAEVNVALGVFDLADAGICLSVWSLCGPASVEEVNARVGRGPGVLTGELARSKAASAARRSAAASPARRATSTDAGGGMI